jgi:O-methyltransferase
MSARNPKHLWSLTVDTKRQHRSKKTIEVLSNVVSAFQEKMLHYTGWIVIRENPCRKRTADLSQEGYFETFDYIRLAQLELIADHIRQFSIPGDCAELGVYKGYFAQKIHEFLPEKRLVLYDTFQGFDERDINVEKVVSPESAEDSFGRTGVESVLSLFKNREQISIRRGYFPDSAQEADGPFCFVSLDVDLYKPTLEGLNFFYPRLTSGGMMLVHDYHNRRYPGVSKALREFFPNGSGFVPIPDKNGSALIVKPYGQVPVISPLDVD